MKAVKKMLMNAPTPSMVWVHRSRWQCKDKMRKASLAALHTTTVWRFRAEEPPFSQIAKVICGRAFVSIHLRPVSTPSLRSVGHSSQVHGTQAQIYLATSPYLYVRCNVFWRNTGTRTSALKSNYSSVTSLLRKAGN